MTRKLETREGDLNASFISGLHRPHWFYECGRSGRVPGQEQEAEQEYRKALELNPDLERAKRGLEALSRH